MNAVETQEALLVLFVGLTLPIGFVVAGLVAGWLSEEWALWVLILGLVVGALITLGVAFEKSGPLPDVLQPQDDRSVAAALVAIYFSAYGVGGIAMAILGAVGGAVVGYAQKPKPSTWLQGHQADDRRPDVQDRSSDERL